MHQRDNVKVGWVFKLVWWVVVLTATAIFFTLGVILLHWLGVY